MASNGLGDDLRAIAGDSETDAEGEQEVEYNDGKQSNEQSASEKPSRGVAQRKKSTQPEIARRRKRDEDDDDEGEISDASHDSLGSDAMSESDSDKSPNPQSQDVDDGVIFPVDGQFYSEKDKAEIMAMSEIKREEILAERAQELERRTQDMHLRRLLQAREQDEAKAVEKRKRKAGTTDLDDSPRKSSRTKTKASENLEAYKRQREQVKEQRQRDNDRRARDPKSPSQVDGDSDADAEGESDVDWDEGVTKPEPTRVDPLPELRDFERVRVGRTNFAKVCFYPGFEEAIKGCFCRVNIGPDRATGHNQYRMTQVKGFKTGKLYAMEGQNGKPFHTDQYVILAQGKAEKDWPFLFCSDSKFTEAEFDRYKRNLTTDGVRQPTFSFLSNKLAGIHKLLNHSWTEAELAEKLRRSGVLQNKYASLERNRILDERKRAVTANDESAIARLDQELAALDGPKLAFGTSLSSNAAKLNSPRPQTQQDRLAALNRANRRANQEEIRKAQILAKQREQQRAAQVARGEVAADRFARVKTKAKVHHDADQQSGSSSQQASNKAIDDLFGESAASDISRAGTPANGETSASNAGKKSSNGSLGTGGFRKRNMDDEVLGALDLGIEIDI